MVKKTKTTIDNPVQSPSPVRHIGAAKWARLHLKATLLLVIASLFVSGVVWFYHDHALPNVRVGNTPVGQQSRKEIEQTIAKQQSLLKVTFVDRQQRITVPAEILGVTINSNETVNAVMRARSLTLWQPHTVPLTLDTDPGVLRAYVQEHYPAISVDAQDAQLIYNAATKQFNIKPGTAGRGFDVAWFEAQLPDLAQNPRTMALKVEATPTEPIITEQSLRKTQQTINEQIKLPLSFTAGGRPVYTATSDDISSLVQFIPDAVTRTAKIEYDQAKVEQFLAQKVGASIARPPIDRKVIVDKDDGSQFVLAEGRAGQQIQDIEKIAEAVTSALTHGRPLTKELSMVNAPYKTVEIQGSDHWLEVDLSEQTLTMYIDKTPINTFLISSGKARTPTPTGTFHVYMKRLSQTMTGTFAGDHFYLTDVKWVNYINGDVAIHGTYWHHNFGHPMSHGCINMTESAAKLIYSFAPVGTKVVVHT